MIGAESEKCGLKKGEEADPFEITQVVQVRKREALAAIGLIKSRNSLLDLPSVSSNSGVMSIKSSSFRPLRQWLV